MIVDGQDYMLEFLSRILRRISYTANIHPFNDVDEAKDALEGWHYDVVITDLRMPGPEVGYSFSKHVNKKYPNTRLCVISSDPTGDYVKKLEKLGITVESKTDFLETLPELLGDFYKKR